MLTKSEMISIMNHAVQKIEESGPNEIADNLKEVIYQLENDDWKNELEAEDVIKTIIDLPLNGAKKILNACGYHLVAQTLGYSRRLDEYVKGNITIAVTLYCDEESQNAPYVLNAKIDKED